LANTVSKRGKICVRSFALSVVMFKGYTETKLTYLPM
jgi:hypothetical protein